MFIFHYSTKFSANLSVFICAMTELEGLEKFMCLLAELTDYPESVVLVKVDKII